MYPQPLLLGHLQHANWAGVDEELLRLERGDQEDFDELILADAVVAVCKYDFCNVASTSPEYRAALVRRLVAAGAHMGMVISDQALSGAVQANDPLLLDTLLELGARPARDVPRPRQELGPVLYAMGLGHIPLLEKLLRHGADLREVDLDGCTGMHYAVAGDQHEMMRFLVQKGLRPNEKDGQGRTPLLSELSEMRPDTVDVLLGLGASLNVRDGQGKHLAVHAAESGSKAGHYLRVLFQTRDLERKTGNAPAPSSRPRF